MMSLLGGLRSRLMGTRRRERHQRKRFTPVGPAPLERRELLTATPVSDTLRFPYSAVVSIEADFQTPKGVETRTGTGALVDTFHVLTNAHNVEHPDLGKPIFLRVYAGRNGASGRFFGEAKVVGEPIINQTEYQHGAGAGGDWDLAILKLDRNIGMPSLAGWLSFGWTSDLLITQISQQTLPMQVIGYPGHLADSPDADGLRQFTTGGRIMVGLGLDPDRFWYDPAEITTFQGNSGSPVIDNSPEWRVPTIIGVHVGNQDVRGNGQPLGAAIRITKAKWDWLIQAMGRRLDNPFQQAKGPTDRPDLMDRDRWANRKDSDFQVTVTKLGSRIKVSAFVFNGGTSRAAAFRVSYYLSRDNKITTSDVLLGTQTVNGLSAAKTTTVAWSGALPKGVARGNYYVGWIIDSTNRVASYSRQPNAPFRLPSSTGYVRRYVLPIGGIRPMKIAAPAPAPARAVRVR